MNSDEFEIERLKDENARRDAQRKMVWLSLAGLLSYPLVIIISELLGAEKSAALISSMAPTYFLAVAGIVSCFFITEKRPG